MEGSICEAYIIEEISTLCSLYFEPTVESRFTQVPRNDDASEVESLGRLSIFTYPGRSLGRGSWQRLLNEKEYHIVSNYVLFNCEEMIPYME